MSSIRLQNKFPGEAVEASLYGLFKTRLDELPERNKLSLFPVRLKEVTSEAYFASEILYSVMWSIWESPVHSYV